MSPCAAATAGSAEACAAGLHWDFLSRRADVYEAKGDLARALADLNAAVDLRPELPALHLDRARVLEKRREWEAAGRDLIDSMRLEAGGEWAHWLLPRIVQGLSTDGYAAHQRGDRETAVRLLELASQLSPFDPRAHVILFLAAKEPADDVIKPDHRDGSGQTKPEAEIEVQSIRLDRSDRSDAGRPVFQNTRLVQERIGDDADHQTDEAADHRPKR